MWTGYAKILRMLVDGRVTWRHLADGLQVARRESSHTILYGLRAAGMAHIAGWEMDGDARSRRPAFAFGPGPDVPWPGGERHRSRKAPPSELLAFIVAVRSLMDEPRHGKGLAKLTGQAPSTARRVIKALHAERLVYIDHYDDRERAGAGYPLYAWGPGEPDAKKPRPQSNRALQRKHAAYRRTLNATANLLHAIAGSSLRSTRQLAHNAAIVGAAT